MLHTRVNGYDMPYISVGQGAPLVCVHGSLGDFRSWSCVLGPLSREHRVIAPSLRRFFPEHWDGVGDGFTVAQHVADLVAFLEGLGGAIDLLGHSRGGHIAFRLAQQRPDLVRRLILAELGGDLDASLAPDAGNAPPPLRSHAAAAAEKIAAGDIDGGLAAYVDAINGPGAWANLPAAARQQRRDNARTLLGQVSEGRHSYSRADAEQLRTPTLFIGGADTRGSLPIVLRALAAHVPGARLEIISNAAHSMFVDDPVRFCAVVLDFLRAP
jgi:pimeloyl-ACP methyl ester carboxylesterase